MNMARHFNAIDVDSKQVFDSLAIIRFGDKDHYFIDEMHKTTQVTQTKKKLGSAYLLVKPQAISASTDQGL